MSFCEQCVAQLLPPWKIILFILNYSGGTNHGIPEYKRPSQLKLISTVKIVECVCSSFCVWAEDMGLFLDLLYSTSLVRVACYSANLGSKRLKDGPAERPCCVDSPVGAGSGWHRTSGRAPATLALAPSQSPGQGAAAGSASAGPPPWSTWGPAGRGAELTSAQDASASFND